MTLDPLSGVEIELVFAQGDRLTFASALADAVGGRVELGTMLTKVAVPEVKAPRKDMPAAIIAAIRETAAWHQATVQRVSSDGKHFFLEHRIATVHDSDGVVCKLVHDNTLPGGERVCEIVTAPLRAEALRRRLEQILSVLRGRHYAFTETAATHVHLEHAIIATPSQLARLIAVFADREADLRRALRTPAGLMRAKPLTKNLLHWQPRSEDWPTARRELAPLVRHKDHALNLYNLVTADPAKPTIELKIGAASDDVDYVMTMRTAFIQLIE